MKFHQGQTIAQLNVKVIFLYIIEHSPEDGHLLKFHEKKFAKSILLVREGKGMRSATYRIQLYLLTRISIEQMLAFSTLTAIDRV